MIADACNLACGEIYDTTLGSWKDNGPCLPSLYISTELDKSEVQTMCLAFLSGVNEEKILSQNHLSFNERSRVEHAVDILSKSNLYIDIIYDFSMKDIENSIRRNHREHGVMYVFFDYLQTTVKTLGEIASQTNGMRLREDNVLFMTSAMLKDIANKLGIFIMSATQLNAGYKTDDVPDQSLLRGAKSIADRLDFGCIALDVTDADIEKLGNIIQHTGVTPNIKMSVYKNRRGAHNRIFLWMVADKGTCRYETVYATDFFYRPYELGDTSVEVEDDTDYSDLGF